MRHLKTFLTVIGAVTILVLASNTIALATTGHAFILGRSNSANRVTALSRTTGGPALTLHTTSSAAAPMTVNGKGKVTNLNADMVDGYDSSALLNPTRLYESTVATSATGGFSRTSPTVAAGDYLVSLSGWIYGPTTGSGVECWVKSSTRYLESWMPVNASGFYTLTITGVLRLGAAQALHITCQGPSADYSTFGSEPLQLSLTKVGLLTSGSLARKAGSVRLAPQH